MENTVKSQDDLLESLGIKKNAKKNSSSEEATKNSNLSKSTKKNLENNKTSNNKIANKQKIKIASWNMQLSNTQYYSSKISNYDHELCAKYIAKSNLDIIIAQIISITSTSADGIHKNNLLDFVIEELKKTYNQNWKYKILPSLDKKDFNSAVLWRNDKNKSLKMVGQMYTPPVDRRMSKNGRIVWSRQPQAIQFSAGNGKNDFVLVSVYHKADYSGMYQETRFQEGKELINVMPQIKDNFQDQDIIIIGRMGLRLYSDLFNHYRDNGFRDLNYLEKGSLFSIDDLGTIKKEFTCNIFVTKEESEFEESEFFIQDEKFLSSIGASLRDFGAKVSKYLLVWTEIDIINDDD